MFENADLRTCKTADASRRDMIGAITAYVRLTGRVKMKTVIFKRLKGMPKYQNKRKGRNEASYTIMRYGKRREKGNI